MRVSRLFTVLVVGSTLLSVAACTATPVASYDATQSKSKKSTKATDDTGDDTADDTGDDTSTNSKTPSPDPTPAPTPTPTTGPNVTATDIPSGTCGAAANKWACVGCCLAPKVGGTTGGAAGANAFGACVCQSPGVCATDCKTTFCAGKQASAACDSCMNNKAMQCEDAAMQGSGSFDVETIQCLLTCF